MDWLKGKSGNQKPMVKICFWLVVWSPLKNISQLGWLFHIIPNIWENRKCSKPSTRFKHDQSHRNFGFSIFPWSNPVREPLQNWWFDQHGDVSQDRVVLDLFTKNVCDQSNFTNEEKDICTEFISPLMVSDWPGPIIPKNSDMLLKLYPWKLNLFVFYLQDHPCETSVDHRTPLGSLT